MAPTPETAERHMADLGPTGPAWGQTRRTPAGRKAAQKGPVFITSRGCPVHVLLSIEEWITGKRRSIVDALAMPGIADIELEIPKRTELPRAADLT